MMNNDFTLDRASVRLVHDAPFLSGEKIDTPLKAALAVGRHICDYDREAVAVVNIDSAMRPINGSIVSIGALNHALAHPRELLKSSFLSNASFIMLIHNHPSGDVKPGIIDTNMTKRMMEICNLVEIPLIDNIIVSNRNNEFKYFGMKEEGVLDYLEGELKKMPHMPPPHVSEPLRPYHLMEPACFLDGLDDELSI